MRTPRIVTACLALFVGTSLLAACGSSGSSATTDTSSAASTTAAVGSTPASTVRTSTTGAQSTTTAAAPGAPCVSAHLEVTLGDAGAAAGSRYQTVVFTNTGSVECSLTGYPGVSLVDAQGGTIGEPADRAPGDATKVLLAAHDGAASFFIHTTGDMTGGGCLAPSTSISVIAPNQTEATKVPAVVTVCGTFEVSPVVAGTTGHA